MKGDAKALEIIRQHIRNVVVGEQQQWIESWRGVSTTSSGLVPINTFFTTLENNKVYLPKEAVLVLMQAFQVPDERHIRLPKFLHWTQLEPPPDYVDPEAFQTKLPQPQRRVCKILQEDVLDRVYEQLFSGESLHQSSENRAFQNPFTPSPESLLYSVYDDSSHIQSFMHSTCPIYPWRLSVASDDQANLSVHVVHDTTHEGQTSFAIEYDKTEDIEEGGYATRDVEVIETTPIYYRSVNATCCFGVYYKYVTKVYPPLPEEKEEEGNEEEKEVEETKSNENTESATNAVAQDQDDPNDPTEAEQVEGQDDAIDTEVPKEELEPSAVLTSYHLRVYKIVKALEPEVEHTGEEADNIKEEAHTEKTEEAGQEEEEMRLPYTANCILHFDKPETMVIHSLEISVDGTYLAINYQDEEMHQFRIFQLSNPSEETTSTSLDSLSPLMSLPLVQPKDEVEAYNKMHFLTCPRILTKEIKEELYTPSDERRLCRRVDAVILCSGHQISKYFISSDGETDPKKQWQQLEYITASAVSESTNFLAVSTTNGSVIVWNIVDEILYSYMPPVPFSPNSLLERPSDHNVIDTITLVESNAELYLTALSTKGQRLHFYNVKDAKPAMLIRSVSTAETTSNASNQSQLLPSMEALVIPFPAVMNLPLVIVSYNNGHLLLYDTRTGDAIGSIHIGSIVLLKDENTPNGDFTLASSQSTEHLSMFIAFSHSEMNRNAAIIINWADLLPSCFPHWEQRTSQELTQRLLDTDTRVRTDTKPITVQDWLEKASGKKMTTPTFAKDHTPPNTQLASNSLSSLQHEGIPYRVDLASYLDEYEQQVKDQVTVSSSIPKLHRQRKDLLQIFASF